MLDGVLTDFSLKTYERIIKISSATYGDIEIVQDWSVDGTPNKPWTYVNGDDSYGRLSIWENPVEYAEDIIDVLNTDSDVDDDLYMA